MEAQRAAEIIYGSSAASSIHSVNSVTGVGGRMAGEGGPYINPRVPELYQGSGSYNPPGPGSFPSGPAAYPGLVPPQPPQRNASHDVSFNPNVSHLRYMSYTTNGSGGEGVRHYPVIMTDDLVSGTQHNNRMSPVRRFFCLLVTFDVLFIALLWIITLLVTGRDLVSELHAQVMEYTIRSSMFDCVMVASIRFMFCVCGYAVLDLSHWCVVATTTAGTVAFVVAKVFLYQWNASSPITYDVLLVLMSFIMAWSEAWMLDFRVLPLENKAKEIWGSRLNSSDTERTPLLAPSQSGGMLQRYIEGSTLYEGSIGNFYSPMESPDHSDDDDDEVSNDSGIRIPGRFRRRRDAPFSKQENDYKKLGEEVLQQAWRTLNSDGWVLEKELSNGDSVHVKLVNGKRVFKLRGLVPISPRLLLEELFFRIDNVPSWNPTLTDCKNIQPIDEHTDISYQVCAEAAGGVVATRDFVNLRHWDVIDGVFVSAGASIKHPAMPPQPKKIRGENGPGCWAMRPVAGDPHQCVFEWLLDTDLKGWIPQSIIDKALSGAQFEYIENIRRRARSLRDEGRCDVRTETIESYADVAVSAEA
jgi:hypothetical protein